MKNPYITFQKFLVNLMLKWDTASMKHKMVDLLFQEQRHPIGPPIHCQKSQCLHMGSQMQ
ncbi:MAG TPA: hypothetical protein EYQ37_01385 [Candidatus Marinimicrobia bacterium]|nr:hypothetical protein [Candidatus Neomarinimicrobiota bacterium]